MAHNFLKIEILRTRNCVFASYSQGKKFVTVLDISGKAHMVAYLRR